MFFVCLIFTFHKASGQSVNFYPTPINTLGGIFIATTSYGDAGDTLPFVYIDRKLKIKFYAIQHKGFAPHVEVFSSEYLNIVHVIVGANSFTSSSGSGFDSGCLSLKFDLENDLSPVATRLDDEACAIFLKNGYSKFMKMAK